MNKLRKVTLSFILSLLLITGVMPAGTTYSPVVSVEAAVSKKQTAKFVKAVDGDTAKLSVKGRTYTFRFLAVDTPQLNQTHLLLSWEREHLIIQSQN